MQDLSRLVLLLLPMLKSLRLQLSPPAHSHLGSSVLGVLQLLPALLLLLPVLMAALSPCCCQHQGQQRLGELCLHCGPGEAGSHCELAGGA